MGAFWQVAVGFEPHSPFLIKNNLSGLRCLLCLPPAKPAGGWTQREVWLWSGQPPPSHGSPSCQPYQIYPALKCYPMALIQTQLWIPDSLHIEGCSLSADACTDPLICNTWPHTHMHTVLQQLTRTPLVSPAANLPTDSLSEPHTPASSAQAMAQPHLIQLLALQTLGPSNNSQIPGAGTQAPIYTHVQQMRESLKPDFFFFSNAPLGLKTPSPQTLLYFPCSRMLQLQSSNFRAVWVSDFCTRRNRTTEIC